MEIENIVQKAYFLLESETEDFYTLPTSANSETTSVICSNNNSLGRLQGSYSYEIRALYTIA